MTFLHWTRAAARRSASAGSVALITALCGCGGGGGGDNPPASTEPSVTAASANPMPGTPGTVVLTVTGSHLDAGIGVAAPGCTSVTRSSSAPYASGDNVAYYLCPTTLAAPGTLTFTVTRSRDAVALASASHSACATPTLAAAALAGTARYGQDLVVTATGTDVNQGLALTTVGCSDQSMRLSVTPPYVSTAKKRPSSANGMTRGSDGL